MTIKTLLGLVKNKKSEPKTGLSLINNERGASSVLVIFMMIVLVTLGSFAITSANVNLRFSRKSSKWNETYYALNTRGQEFVKDLTIELAKADKSAIEYIIDRGFEKQSYDGISDEMQSQIANAFTNTTDFSAFLSETIDKLYYFYVLKNIEDFDSVYIDCAILPFLDESINDIVRGIAIEMQFADENDVDFHLTAKLDITPIKYDMSYSENKLDVSGIRNSESKFFTVSEWKQWHTPVEVEDSFDDGLELWDGTIDF